MKQDNFCRLCAERKDIFIRIYEEEGQKLNLATKIMQCLQIWLHPEDPLPKAVCNDCCAKVNQYFDFFETTSKAQVSLKMMFEQKMPDKMKDEINHSTSKNTSSEDCALDDHENEVHSSHNGSGEDEEETEVEPLEFVECTEWHLSEKTSSVQEFNESATASSRRKCRIPVKRKLSATKLESLSKNQSKSIVTSRSASCNQAHDSQRSENQDCSFLVNGGKGTDQEVKEEQVNLKCTEAKCCGNNGVRENQAVEKKCSSVETKNTNCQGEMLRSDAFIIQKNVKSVKRKRDPKLREKTPRPKTMMDDYPWQCTTCATILGSLQELRQHHHNIHKQLPAFKCIHCDKTYTRYRSFTRHVNLHRNPKKYKCEECGKCFNQKTVLQSHRTVHTDARPHICNQCGKSFKQFSSLYLHSKCHLPDQVKTKFQCDICNKNFAAKHTLETHRKIHTGERNFICDVCGKSFVTKGSLEYHILTHSAEKPHHCSVCGKAFRTARLLSKHATLHTGIKPHQCDVCGKQFRERGALREHGRIHTGAMPYTCEFCGKNFRFKGILTVHRRQHTGERPYSCAECRREFTNWANYNKHMKRRHRNPEDPSLLSNNRVNAQNYQPTSGLPCVPENTSQTIPSEQLVNSLPSGAVSSLSNTCTLNQHMYDNTSSSNNMNSLTHINFSPSAGRVTNTSGMYINSSFMSKASSIYGTQAPGSTMNVGIPNKMHSTGSLPDMFHGGNTVVRSIGNNIQKVPSIGNVFHGSHQHENQDSVERGMERSQHNNHMMSSYHMPSYVSAGLPMGGMGYYIPPIHHAEHGIDMLHNSMGNNQLSGNS